MKYSFHFFACALMLFLLMFCHSSLCGSGEERDYKKLPYCPERAQPKYGPENLIFVSTLDGFVSALNAVDEGSLIWSISTGSEPLLSSSIHRLELTNNGHWVRMIPSLRGGLYKFDGDSLQIIPVTADQLLRSSSFIFTDVVISGGKESQTYGISLKNGQVLYTCSMRGCDNHTDNLSPEHDVLVIQRQSQTVRAIEARSGVERWNFSVGLHDLKIMKDPNVNCYSAGHSLLDFELKIIIPEGLVCAVTKSKPEKLLWKHKFNSPVVGVWVVKNGELNSVDLVSGSQLLPSYVDDMGPISPSLYIGMHKKQLYIQESVRMHKYLEDVTSYSIKEESFNILQIPWQPIPASSTVLGIGTTIQQKADTSLQVVDAPTTALSVLYGSEYVNGNGYYLFSKESFNRKCSAAEDKNVTFEEPLEINSYTLPVSWKEILIGLVIAAAAYFIFNPRPLYFIQKILMMMIKTKRPLTVLLDKEDCLPLFVRKISEPGGQVTHDFMSQFQNNFELVKYLGKGGFGIVFEAKNKIDELGYAIKRIPLPNRQESQDRVMREVKTLAKLDHKHIIRYFNAWVECCPSGLQENHDGSHLSSAMDSCTSVDVSESHRGINQGGHVTFNESLPGREDQSSFMCVQNNNFDDHSCSSSLNESGSFIVFEQSQNSCKETCPPMNQSVPFTESEKCQTSSDETHEFRKNCVSREQSSYPDVDSGSVSKMYLYIQMQLCQRSLNEWLQVNTGPRDTHEVLRIFEQIVQAVEYIHLQGLIHRDLKPSNILFSFNGEIKVGDFGLVTAMLENTPEQTTACHNKNYSFNKRKHTSHVGTKSYMSPEQMNGQPYDYKVDIYSLGLIFFELLVPFTTQMHKSQTFSDLKRNKFPSDFIQQYGLEHDLLQQMLSHNPALRPTTFGIRSQPPLSGISADVPANEQWHFELPPLQR